MKLETIEKKLHMTYPKDFRDIYESGAMRWVCGKPQAKSHLFPNKLLEPKYYPCWNLLEFWVVEWFNLHLIERVQADGGQWKEGVQILPFALEDDGDVYFFNAALGEQESTVFLLSKFSGEVGLFCHSFENFICAHLCEPVCNGKIAVNHWWVQNQLRWLTPEHQAALTSDDPDVLKKLLEQTNCREDIDYISYR